MDASFAELAKLNEPNEPNEPNEINETGEAGEAATTGGSPEQADSPAPRKKLPLICKILYGSAALSLIFYIAFLFSPDLADFFNRYISPVIRATLATITSVIPFSLAEYLLILSPLIFYAVISFGIRHYGSSWRNVGVFCLILLSVAAYVFSTFALAFAPSYRGTRLDKKMDLQKQEVSAKDLMYTAFLLSYTLENEAVNVKYGSDGASVMPYGYDELGDKLMAAYDKACNKYDFIQDFHSPVKRIMLSEPMTYTHISGVYTFFTGEANINTNFPDYTLPFTAAHELAHQRGFSREDEANFVAFLVCSEADDAYLRYSAYLSLYEYVSNALYTANPAYFKEVAVTLPNCVRGELTAYSKFFEKYLDNPAEKISGTVNNTFLTINGTEGTRSYGLVVDLAVAYFKPKS